MARHTCLLSLVARYDNITPIDLGSTDKQQNGLSIHYTRNDQTLKYVQGASV
jgi:hypothetical protein